MRVGRVVLASGLGLGLAALALSGCSGASPLPAPAPPSTTTPTVTAAATSIAEPTASAIQSIYDAENPCHALLGEDHVHDLQAAGEQETSAAYSTSVRSSNPKSVDARFLNDGGFLCVWAAAPDAGLADLIYAYARQSQSQRVADEAFVRKNAEPLSDSSDLTVYTVKAAEDFLGGADPSRIAFGDGYWLEVTAQSPLDAGDILELIDANRPASRD